MQKIYIDTNYFLRFLIRDVNAQYIKTKEVFEAGARKQTVLFTSNITIFELHWVLKSIYKKNKEECISILQSTLSMNFIQIPTRFRLLQSLQLYNSSSLSFEDCYHLTYAKDLGASDMATFDRKLKRKFKYLV